MDLVLRAGRALIGTTLRPAAVGVVDGRIAAIGPFDAGFTADREEVLAPQAVLLPGFVDTHVHVDDPGTDWEGFASATAAAAAAGITTLVDMPLDSVPVTTSVAALSVKQAAAEGNCAVDVGFWGGVVPDNSAELAALTAAGVRGFKCFLTDSGNPDFGYLSPAQFRRAAAQIADLGSVLLVHAESHDAITAGPAPRGRTYRSFLRSRPAVAEADAVACAIDAAASTGARVHIVHVSSAAALALLDRAKRAAVPVTAETCPHYLTFTAEEIGDGATQFACCPPIRESHHRDRLWTALGDGTLDMVVSDHSPCAPELKAAGDFGCTVGGISSLQVSPAVTWTAARERGFGLAELSRWMSERPAELAGYADRGRIALGLRADLCAFDPDARTVVDAAALRHRHPLSPYHGAELRGSALRTWVAGADVGAQVCQPV
ncbi:allantoinase AllB [Mycobacterium sp. WMMD1722]|uniref:allantoinase AllB n=1 Tax=Mycobacterium sp. WMMD1722 TaxID=3404117 RepID=UPI003BF4E527